MSSDASLEDLDILLSDLGLGSGRVPGSRINADIRPAELHTQAAGGPDASFAKTCDTVLNQVRALERALAGRAYTDFRDPRAIVEIAIARGMPVVTNSSDGGAGDDDRALRVQALSFMCSELQVLRIQAHHAMKKPEKGQARTACRERERVLTILHTLHTTLQVPGESCVSFDRAGQAMTAIAAKAERLSPAGVCEGDAPLLGGVKLTPAQSEMMDKVQRAIKADFDLRWRMLLGRCDVTVQSFMCPKQGDGGVADLSPELKARRAALGSGPGLITVDDALAAPTTIVFEHARKIVEGSTASETATRMAEISEVPDRGGRVDAARAGPAMPAWTARKEFDGRKGGRGGGGRQRWGGGNSGGRGGPGRGKGGERGHRGGGGGGGGGGSGRGRGRGHKRKWTGRGDRG